MSATSEYKTAKVYILIPIHNNITETRKCLSCIYTQTYTNYEIIVIDDGSTDNSTEIIKKEFSATTILQGDGNLWWAGALYEGIEYVLKKAKNTDYILTLNNDLTFGEEYIKNLINASKNNPDALIGSLVLDQKTDKIVDSSVMIDWVKFRFDLMDIGNKNDDAIRGADVITTRGLLIPIYIVQEIGNFIPDKLRHYFSDYEYTIRAKKYGYTLLTSKKAIAYLNRDTTGLHFNPKEDYTLKDLYKEIFSIQSSGNLKAWLIFLYICCPLHYKPICYIRIVGGRIKWLIKGIIKSITKNT